MANIKIDWESKALPGHKDIGETISHLYRMPGAHIDSVAEELKVSYSALRDKMLELKIRRKRRGAPLVRWELMIIPGCSGITETINLLYREQGLTIQQTADKLGVDFATLRKKMRALGIEMKKSSVIKNNS